MSSTILVINDIYKEIDNNLINDKISFEVKKGDICCILGANGAGKSTLIKQIVGIWEPTGGKVNFIINNMILKAKEISKYVSYQSQASLTVLRGLTVGEAIFYTGKLKKLTKKECIKQTKEFITYFNLEKILNYPLYKLSGGQRQLTSICMTLIGKQKILIFDEPTNNLDPKNKMKFVEYISRLNREEDTTIIIVTHDLEEFESIINHVIILHNGKIIAKGDPQDLSKTLKGKMKITIKTRDNPGDEKLSFLRQFGQIKQVNEEKLILFCEKDTLSMVMDSLKEIDIINNIMINEVSLKDKYYETVGGI